MVDGGTLNFVSSSIAFALKAREMGLMLLLRCFELREKCLCHLNRPARRLHMRNEFTLPLHMTSALADMPLDHFEFSFIVVHGQRRRSGCGSSASLRTLFHGLNKEQF